MKRRELGGKKAVCSSVERYLRSIVLKKWVRRENRRCPFGILSLQCVSQVLYKECVCVSEIGKEKNDADVEEEVATGDSRFFLVISLLAIHHPI